MQIPLSPQASASFLLEFSEGLLANKPSASFAEDACVGSSRQNDTLSTENKATTSVSSAQGRPHSIPVPPRTLAASHGRPRGVAGLSLELLRRRLVPREPHQTQPGPAPGPLPLEHVPSPRANSTPLLPTCSPVHTAPSCARRSCHAASPLGFVLSDEHLHCTGFIWFF